MSAKRTRTAAVTQDEARSLEERLRKSEADFARAQRQASIGTWRWADRVASSVIVGAPLMRT